MEEPGVSGDENFSGNRGMKRRLYVPTGCWLSKTHHTAPLFQSLTGVRGWWPGRHVRVGSRGLHVAVAMIPGVEEGSISVVTARRNVGSQAPTGELPVQVDAIQDETQQGPCMDAAYEHLTVRVDDLATEDRWPLFARRASAAGAASMLSLQLYVEGDNLGALNLYARTPYAFTDESEQVGLLFAAHAAIAYAGVRKAAQLGEAVVSRDLIGQTKGIVTERYKISGERAFLLLTRVSQASNRKLLDIAAELVDRGTISGAEAPALAPGPDRPRR